MSSFTAQWHRWWPLPAAVLLTAIALPGSGVLNGLPVAFVVVVGLVVVLALWGFIELLAQQNRQQQGKPLVVYPAHQAAAGPKAWLLTTPEAYRWLGGWLVLGGLLLAVQAWQDAAGMPAVNTIVGLVAALALLVATGVLLALIIARRSTLGLLSALVFAVLLAFSSRLHVTPPAEYALIYGVGLVVVAGAVWWCRRHPRSIDPRTEKWSA